MNTQTQVMSDETIHKFQLLRSQTARGDLVDYVYAEHMRLLIRVQNLQADLEIKNTIIDRLEEEVIRHHRAKDGGLVSRFIKWLQS